GTFYAPLELFVVMEVTGLTLAYRLVGGQFQDMVLPVPFGKAIKVFLDGVAFGDPFGTDEYLQFPVGNFNARLGQFDDQGVQVQVPPFQRAFEGELEVVRYFVIGDIVLGFQILHGIVIDRLFLRVLHLVEPRNVILHYTEVYLLFFKSCSLNFCSRNSSDTSGLPKSQASILSFSKKSFLISLLSPFGIRLSLESL